MGTEPQNSAVQHRAEDGTESADAEDDAGGRGAERVEVVVLAGAGGHVRSEQRIVAGAVIMCGQPESAGIGSGLPREAGRDRARSGAR